MFENLSDRLSGVFDRLTKQGALSADDVKTALRDPVFFSSKIPWGRPQAGRQSPPAPPDQAANCAASACSVMMLTSVNPTKPSTWRR